MTDMKKEVSRQMIAGLGSALVDVLAKEDDHFLQSISDIKGGMTLVANEFIEDVCRKLTGDPLIVPGGAACNTIIGIGRLGGKARFVAKRGKDRMGTFFEDDLRNNNVEPCLSHSDSPNGRVLSIITPDAQRSMFTCLGAAAELSPGDITDECFKGAAIVLIEAYLLYNSPSPVMAAIAAARKAGARIAMDLSSFTVVQDFKKLLENEIVPDVDILIANEDEARAFTGYSEEDMAINALSAKAEIAVLKIGKRGSYIAHQGQVIHIPPMGDGAAADTTGAGDLWAAGFLYGLVNGYPLEKCGEIASACGYEVCQVVGAKIPEDGWDRIKKLLI